MPRTNGVEGTKGSIGGGARPGIAIASSNESSKSQNKNYKYIKPRIGSSFQACIEPYDVATSETDDRSSGSSRKGETECASSSTTSSKKKRGPGRPKSGKSRHGTRQPAAELVPSMAFANSTSSLGSSSAASFTTTTCNTVNGRWVDDVLIPERGGLCVHRPASQRKLKDDEKEKEDKADHDHFLTFARNIILQTPRKSIASDERADYLWKNAMNKKRYGLLGASAKKSNNGGRRGKKRKLMALPDDDDLAWGAIKDTNSELSSTTVLEKNDIGESQQTELDRNDRGTVLKPESPLSLPDVAIGMEDDEPMLEYLELKQSGNYKRAQFLALSELSMGQAFSTRKYLQKMRKEDDIAAPLSAVLAPLSESWRRRYERLGQTMVGDTRRRPGFCKYPFVAEVSYVKGSSDLYPWSMSGAGNNTSKNNMKKVDAQFGLDCESTNFNDEISEMDKGLMKAWKSLLECAQKVVENIEVKKEARLDLRDVLILVGKAYSIPKPEDVFGRRDSISKHISQCMNTILDQVDVSRDLLAKLSDCVFDKENEGIDLDSLRKVIEDKKKSSLFYLDEFRIVDTMLDEASSWESKLNRMSIDDEVENCLSSDDLNIPQQSLATAEGLVSDGRELPLRPRSLVLLGERIERAYVLRSRIREWNKSQTDETENVKFISSMIKEANRINLGFPELSILSKLHKNAEEWIDRATIAIRSKISLGELESLVQNGEKMPIDLSDILGKLRNRYDQACEWINLLKSEVPCPLECTTASGNNLNAINRAEWFTMMRETLQNGSEEQTVALVDLSAKGSRIPVEIDFLHLLQTAIDGRNWSLKAKRWIPNAVGESTKRGKIEDLRDHLTGADTIRSSAKAITDGKSDWVLDYEEDLLTIVTAADEWYKKYRPFLVGDNRRAQGRCSIAFSKLQQIVAEADLIPANLGNSSIKMNRIYSQAHAWAQKNYSTLSQCGINIAMNLKPEGLVECSNQSVNLEEVNAVIASAAKDIPVDLEEVKELNLVTEKAQDWFDRAVLFAPKRNKRNVRGKKGSRTKHTIKEIVALIEEASLIPMDTRNDVERLKMQLSDIQSWRLQAQCDIRIIADCFQLLRKARIAFYGLPNEFIENLPGVKEKCSNPGNNSQTEVSQSSEAYESNTLIGMKVDPDDAENINLAARMSFQNRGKNVYKMVANLVKSAESISVFSIEEEVAEELENVTIWCKKAANIIGSPHDVFIEKKWVQNLDNLIKEGESLILQNEESKAARESQFDDKALLSQLNSSWSSLVSDDKIRLEKLKIQRDDFHVWCDKAKDILADKDKKIPLEVLKQLSEESSIYPPTAETVKQIQRDATAACKWATHAGKLISSGETITLDEAKDIVAEGIKLNISCPEFKTLRNALRMARGWANRVKKSGLDEGSAQISEIKDLIREHETFLVSLPDEITSLKQAMCGYCICRRPYDGFMIGCDECEEWYHGQCIGVSEAQAERVDKYVCVRCCVQRVYKNASNSIASVIRKWCDPKELSKARSHDGQKHQRKVREKKREIVKLNEELEADNSELVKMNDSNGMDKILNNCDSTLGSINNSKINSSNCTIKNVNKGNLSSLDPPNPKEIALRGKILKSKAALEQCNHRLEELAQIRKDRKSVEEREDLMAGYLQYWCVMVRSQVFCPDTEEIACRSRPSADFPCNHPDKLLSDPMKGVIREAKKSGIIDLPDVSLVVTSFHCLAWCLSTFSVLRKKPQVEDLKCLIHLANSIKLPEVKSVGMIRSMVSRAAPWQAKVNKFLAPIPGESKPFDMQVLKELRTALSIIPVTMPEESKLYNSITDGGSRHCICGGPNDGSFMISCDKCELWFHGNCVNVAEDSVESVSNWICPICSNSKIGVVAEDSEKREISKKPHRGSRIKGGMEQNLDEDISSHAPDPGKLWPPLGLVDSTEAREALGNICKMNIENTEQPSLPLRGSHADIQIIGEEKNKNQAREHLQHPNVSMTHHMACSLSTNLISMSRSANASSNTFAPDVLAQANTIMDISRRNHANGLSNNFATDMKNSLPNRFPSAMTHAPPNNFSSDIKRAPRINFSTNLKHSQPSNFTSNMKNAQQSNFSSNIKHVPPNNFSSGRTQANVAMNISSGKSTASTFTPGIIAQANAARAAQDVVLMRDPKANHNNMQHLQGNNSNIGIP